MSDRKSYMNLCPVCEQSFMCEHKRDTRCPYCRIAELEADAEMKDGLRKLPEKWRGPCNNELTRSGKCQCADELEALLDKESEDGNG